jgi:hypothetical protein
MKYITLLITSAKPTTPTPTFHEPELSHPPKKLVIETKMRQETIFTKLRELNSRNLIFIIPPEYVAAKTGNLVHIGFEKFGSQPAKPVI